MKTKSGKQKANYFLIRLQLLAIESEQMVSFSLFPLQIKCVSVLKTPAMKVLKS